VVGFDLDMTLGDTSHGILASLEETMKETRVSIDLDAAKERLGIPIQDELAHHFPVNEVERATEIFRRHMGAVGVRAATPLPGAREAVEHVRGIGGRSLVLTTKHRPLAIATLAHLGIEVGADDVIGNFRSDGKAAAIQEAGALGYVGDHVNDMRAARLAESLGVGVTTGNHSSQELYEAGAHHVLTTLEDFPPLLDQIIDATK